MPIELGANALINSTAAPSLKKPVYLISLVDGTGKTVKVENFITTDKPGLEMGFVSVRGFFTDQIEEDVVRNFADIVNKTPKEQIVEMMFPVHRIKYIRSLVFNAVKTVQPIPVGKQ